MTTRTGGRILVDQLAQNGVELIFGVPGESYLAALDALVDRPEMRFVICRQEGGAAMMADAHARLTGRPGVAFVTRGPGATNASPAVHIARQDSVPLVLLVGQIDSAFTGREAFQEIDYQAYFGPIAKWVVEVDGPERLPEIMHRAFATALSGRPGPVVVSLPEDVLFAEADIVDAPAVKTTEAAPDPAAIAEIGERLTAAKKPFLLLGGGGWDDTGYAAVRRFAEAWRLPVGCGFRRQSLFDNDHPSYAGHVGLTVTKELGDYLQEADLILTLGSRMSEASSDSYRRFPHQGTAGQALVHIHNDPAELGRVYRADVAVPAGLNRAAEALAALPGTNQPAWAEDTERLHQGYLASRATSPANPGPLQYGEIMRYLAEALPADAILCNGAGNYAIWVHRFLRYRNFRTQLAPTSGSMGYGTPAAVGAKLTHPDRLVVAFAGDGCFLMNGQEFATAVQHDAAIVVIVVDNGQYGTIRMHQERDYPGRRSGTELKNPDFAALARAYGGHGETVEATSEFPAAWQRALASGKPALIALKLDPRTITPDKFLDA
ncbi:MAG: thiamine pyrophosphate-binding protein [Geminicoccaceae bacterium]|nr:MAG: thiamine pyrophosphate-binding protein [Geminicoccaceae bacterium]